jgi:hypothetical protein
LNVFTKLALDWAVARAKEPSTWNGLALTIAASLHVAFNPNFQSALAALGVAIGGLLGVVLKEGVTK